MSGTGQAAFQWWFVIPGLAAMMSALLSTVLVYRFTHRHSMRSNAEKWLDAVREDISELVSLHWVLCRIEKGEAEVVPTGESQGDFPQGEATADAKGRSELLKQKREWQKQRLSLLVRLRLRLTKQDQPLHQKLLDATNRLVAAQEEDEQQAAQNALIDAGCDLVRTEWHYIKSGRRKGEPAENYLG